MQSREVVHRGKIKDDIDLVLKYNFKKNQKKNIYIFIGFIIILYCKWLSSELKTYQIMRFKSLN